MQNQLFGSFGRTIAFVIPGMIALYALGFLEPSLHSWFGLTQPPTIAGFLFTVLASIGVGVFVSGIRYAALDWLLMPKVELNHGDRKDHNTEVAFQALVANHYQFYQFHTNSAVSISLLLVIWILTQNPDWLTISHGVVTVLFIVTLSGLFAKNAINIYYKKASEILGTIGGESA